MKNDQYKLLIKRCALSLVMMTAVLFSATISQEDSVKLYITVHDATNTMDLTYGWSADATDGYDNNVDHYAPPAPPSGSFDARLSYNSEDYLTDIRAPYSGQEIVWDVSFKASTGNAPVVLEWDPTKLPSDGTFVLKDPYGGSIVNINMRDVSSYTDTDTAPDQLQIVYSISNESVELSLTVHDAVNTMDLTYGWSTNATDGYDSGLDQYAPPAPPSGSFDARLSYNDEDYLTDIRAPYSSEDIVWNLSFKAGTGNAPVVLEWDPTKLPSDGTFILRDPYGGSIVNVNMRDVSSYTDSDVAPDQLQIVYTNSVTEIKANFNSDVQSGSYPLDVQFTDLSTGDIVSWSWNFGDGDSSTVQNPQHTYSVSGTYTVTLTVTNPYGSDSETKSDYITVYGPPIASYGATPKSGQYPLTVQFTDSSSSDPTSWKWHFGDGDSSTVQNPQHIYTASGTYTVTLIAANPYGSDTETKSDYITVYGPPIASYGATPKSGQYPLTVQFTDSSQSNPTSWSWDFGDDESSTVQNPQHIYTESGTYTVTLTVTNPYGSDTETKSDYITVYGSPIADFGAAPTSGQYPLTVQFTDSSQSDPTSWKWHFGDGDSSSVQNPQHIYTESGTYTITLIAANPYGSDTETKSDYITVNEDTTNIINVNVVSEYELSNAYPSPFNPRTTLKYGLPETTDITLSIFDVTGNKIKQWSISSQQAGWHEVIWDGTDMNRNVVSTGVYIYSLRAGNFVDSKKMVFMK